METGITKCATKWKDDLNYKWRATKCKEDFNYKWCATKCNGD